VTTIGRRIRMTVGIAAVVVLATGALLLAAWSLDDTHFDRPSAEFDELGAELERLPGVEAVEKERWVEAPTFSDPTSWMFVTVSEAGLPGLLEAACTSGYPDEITWHIRVRTPAASEVALNASPSDPIPTASAPSCPDFGFDAVRLTKELDRVAPELAVQPSIWDEGVLTLLAMDDLDQPDAGTPTGFADTLPLIEHADALLTAAGRDADEVVEITSPDLSLMIGPGESAAYLALLADLVHLGATGFRADGGGTPIGGAETVQVVAPDGRHAAIEDAVASSGLRVADLEVRFVEQ
jgi:hypothetical protein